MNPNITLAVAAERMADMRREAERYRAGRQAIALRRAARQRASGRADVHAATAIPADEAGLELSAEALQELCLTGARED